jgi:hypothetical protein
MKGSRAPVIVLTLLMAVSCRSAIFGQEEPSEPDQASAPDYASETSVEVTEETWEPEAAPVPEDAWRSDLDAIADLLIDGRPREAAERATQLLEVQGLPKDVTARAQELRRKAEEKLLSAPAAAPRQKVVVSGRGDEEEEEEEKKDPPVPSFQVRLARIGTGFKEGTIGSLRISEAGLAFVAQGKARGNWTVAWKDLVESRKDEGMWDTAYPFVIVDRRGNRHFLTRIDGKGRYLSSDPVLAAIAEGRRKQKVPKPEAIIEEPDPSENDF